MNNLEKIWEYQTGSKRYRTRAKYFVILILYFLHVEKDYGYEMAKKFKKTIRATKKRTEAKEFYELMDKNKITVLLNALSKYSILHKEEPDDRKRVYYSLNYYGLAHFFIIHYNKVHQISKNVKEVKIFNDVTYTTFQKLVRYYKHFSERLTPEDKIINITNYKKYDFYTMFLHILHFLQTIETYHNVQSEQSVRKKTTKKEKGNSGVSQKKYSPETLKKVKQEYNNHYILKHYNNKEKEYIINKIYNNNLKDLIRFIREATINSLLTDRI
ncbi:hypothetical protein ACFLTH_04395 [Bacteroidota bacterium]